MDDVGNICHNIKWEMQPTFERYFDNDFQNKVAGWISFDIDPIPLLQIEGCASSTCKYTHINTHHWIWWMAKEGKQSKGALFDNWLHKAQKLIFACNTILSFRRTKKINMYWEGNTFCFISTGEVPFFFCIFNCF